MLFTWTDGYSIGIETTDAQHRKIFELINDLYEAMQDGSSSSILKPLMHTVKDYTVTHFALEERYILEAGDPDLGPIGKSTWNRSTRSTTWSIGSPAAKQSSLSKRCCSCAAG